MSLKALTHWLIYKGYRVHFTRRTPQELAGVVITPQGEQPFTYQVQTMTVTLGDRRITLNEHGWET